MPASVDAHEINGRLRQNTDSQAMARLAISYAGLIIEGAKQKMNIAAAYGQTLDADRALAQSATNLLRGIGSRKMRNAVKNLYLDVHAAALHPHVETTDQLPDNVIPFPGASERATRKDNRQRDAQFLADTAFGLRAA
jgi:hypothetical protein